MEIPVVSRVYLTGAFLTTAACAVDIISPFSLYFNWDLVFSQGQIWRLATSYMFFGTFSVDFLFHMYFLVRSCWSMGSFGCCPSRYKAHRCSLFFPLTRPHPQVKYSRMLEEGEFRMQTAKYVWMLLFGIFQISVVASYTNVHFLGSALTFMMAYVWGRRNEHIEMSFLGFIHFNAPYLPWVMLTFR